MSDGRKYNGPLDTGVGTLNDDHSKIFVVLNEVRHGLEKNEPTPDIASGAVFARELFSLHCAKEEYLMKEAGYANFDAAAKDHRKLSEIFDKFIEDVASGAADERNAADLILAIVEHIRTFDRDYAKSINAVLTVPHLELTMFRDVDG